VVGTIINLYPLGNLFAIIVKGITLRNNIMIYCFPKKVEGDVTGFDPIMLLFTAIALGPCFLVAATVQDI
jgi:hypothetical protein